MILLLRSFEERPFRLATVELAKLDMPPILKIKSNINLQIHKLN